DGPVERNQTALRSAGRVAGLGSYGCSALNGDAFWRGIQVVGCAKAIVGPGIAGNRVGSYRLPVSPDEWRNELPATTRPSASVARWAALQSLPVERQGSPASARSPS